jgi:hypothetical protein
MMLTSAMMTAAYHGFLRASTQVSLLMNDFKKKIAFSLNACFRSSDFGFCCLNDVSFCHKFSLCFKAKKLYNKEALYTKERP